MKQIIIATLLICGCNLSPKLDMPKLSLPDSWEKNNQGQKTLAKISWWDNYEDPKLQALINASLTENSDILHAMNNVVKAQSILGINESARLPEVNLQAAYARDKLSKENFTNKGNTKPFNTNSAAGVLSFELDLWGKAANSTKAAQAQLLAMEENKEIVKLTIASEVAKSYFNLLALSQKITLTTKLIANYEEIYKLNEKHLAAGWSAIDVIRQTQSTLEATKQQLPSLKHALIEQENALATLMGKNPSALLEELQLENNIQSLPIPPLMPPLIPAKILEQRPDIKLAEQQLIAANYQIGVAKAEYFPDISLTAMLGLNSNKTSQLSKGNNWQLGANVAQPMFNFGRTSNNVKLANANKQDYLINYEKVIKNAFKEVLNALSSQKTSEHNLAHAQNNQKALAAIALNYQSRYNAGDIDYLKVLEAQQQLLMSKINSLHYYQARLNASVDLFKALGGNWLLAKE
jgi:multidrug efflux system outer membrane protein